MTTGSGTSEVNSHSGESVVVSGRTAETVEIRTDRRRVLDYLLSPLAKIGSEASWEREKPWSNPSELAYPEACLEIPQRVGLIACGSVRELERYDSSPSRFLL